MIKSWKPDVSSDWDDGQTSMKSKCTAGYISEMKVSLEIRERNKHMSWKTTWIGSVEPWHL